MRRATNQSQLRPIWSPGCEAPSTLPPGTRPQKKPGLQYTRTFPLLGACADVPTKPTIHHLGVRPMRYSRFVKRIADTGEASVRLLSTEDSDDGTLLDVSRKGARLCLNRLFRPGQRLTLMLDLPWDEPPVKVRLATVKWVHQGTVGVEFLKVENDDRVSLDVFLASRSKPPTNDGQRKGNRLFF